MLGWMRCRNSGAWNCKETDACGQTIFMETGRAPAWADAIIRETDELEMTAQSARLMAFRPELGMDYVACGAELLQKMLQSSLITYELYYDRS